MHPPLAEHQQTACIEVMNSLKACHDSYPWLKFAGVCNSEKGALNACLRNERLERTSKNAQAAKERRKEIERRWKDIEGDA